ncbi:MAG: hypothetical protein JRD89_06155 [Deltaproteobacteria bacterium]|nr:hypothetical protein [Deltaproteobacteria bacterium]
MKYVYDKGSSMVEVYDDEGEYVGSMYHIDSITEVRSTDDRDRYIFRGCDRFNRIVAVLRGEYEEKR